MGAIIWWATRIVKRRGCKEIEKQLKNVAMEKKFLFSLMRMRERKQRRNRWWKVEKGRRKE